MKSKTKWYSKVLYLAIALALAVSLAGMTAVSAAPAEESEWSDVTTPNAEDFSIALESDIYDFDIASDGETIYAVGMGLDEDAVECGTPTARLWKSEDGGVTWEDLTEDELPDVPDDFDPEADVLWLVSVSPDQTDEDEDFVVVAGWDDSEGVSFVYASGESGENFCNTSFEDISGVTDDILCLDVSPIRDDEYNIAVGTDGGEVWRLELGCAFCPGAWELAGGYDAMEAVYPGWDNSDEDGLNHDFDTEWVTSVAFSPNFDADDTIVVVCATANDHDATHLQTGLWGDTEAWNEQTETFPAAIEIINDYPDYACPVCSSTGIALPEDYTGYDDDLRYSWVYVNYDGDGRVFEIDGFDAEAADIDCGPNDLADDDYPVLGSISMTGTIDDGAIMVGAAFSECLSDGDGCCGKVQVYRTGEWPIDVCCPDWERADKPPTGLYCAKVAYTPDGDKAYAATLDKSCGEESAFSISEIEEVGQYWNQLSLIDTMIDYLSDVAVSPDCGTIYLASVNNSTGSECDSVWLSTDEGDSYIRIWNEALEGDPQNGLIRLNPEEEDEVLNIYLVDQETNVFYWNEDGGLTDWNRRTASTLDHIVDFAVLDESTVYALDEDGSTGVAKSEHNGSRWVAAEDAEVDDGHTIAVLGDYVLVGGLNDESSYSDDEGESFNGLDDIEDGGDIHVAFDSYFGDNGNGVVYAAADNGVYICEDLEEEEWDDLEATDQTYYGIVLDNADGNPMTDEDTGGVLYAVYDYGMARVLGAADNGDEEDWDYLVEGTADVNDDGFIAEPSSLKICGCLTEDSDTLLWAIDAAGYDLEAGEQNLWVYEDCLSKAGVDLSEVEDGATIPSDPCFCWNEEFVLGWDEICDSDTYGLQIALDEDFDYILEFDDWNDYYGWTEVGDEEVMVFDGTLDCNEFYYWRVRVVAADDEVIRSWWSDTWSFMIEAGPLGAIELTAPDDGASNVPIEGIVFTWTTVSEATSYDLILQDSTGFTVVSETGLTGTSYTYAGALGYDEAYTWQVTAMKDGSVLSGSAASTFRTVVAAVFTCPHDGLTFPSQEALQAHLADAHPPVVPVTPAWVWVVIGLGAVLVIVVIVLIFRTRRV